ncbi:MAG: CotH kinase family protein, partial [Verrucomicrobiae bacterium]|nr:CotH kinase family protein [Verrucomicrobiae bacterium]
TPVNGRTYGGPFPIDHTTAVRAVAIRDDWIPSDVITHTYLFPEEILEQPALPDGFPDRWQADYVADYEMDPTLATDPVYGPRLLPSLRSFPTLFLTLPHEDLWGNAAGIYRNSTSRGDAWERAVSAELLLPDGRSGTTGFAINAGLRIQGDASRDNNRTPKHSMRLLFKGEYGPSKLGYDWFDGGVTDFDNIVLRAGFTDSWCTRYSPGGTLGERYRPEDSVYLRDTWMKDTFLAMGQPAGRGTFVHLYLNGLYWGLYNPTERLDASHFSETYGGREMDWDVIRDFGEVMDGNLADWNAMIALVNAGIGSEADYQAVRAWVDVPNLIDYMLLHFFGEAEDWPHHNWYGARHRGTETVRGNRWFFLPWDQEIVADRQYPRDRVDVNNDDTPARIYSELRVWPEFRREFGDRVQRHLGPGGALSVGKNVERLRRRAAEIAHAMVAESARWGDARRNTTVGSQGTGVTLTPDEFWQPEIDALCTNWFPAQPDVLIARLREAGLFPDLDAPLLSPPGGFVSAEGGVSATHANSSGTIYLTDDGSDPREYGTGAVAGTARIWSVPVAITAPVTIRARVWRNGEWSALASGDYRPEQDFAGLQISEIHYHPLPFQGIDGDRFEFLELVNTGPATLYLEGTRIVDGIEFTFPAGAMLPPGERTLVVSDPTAFAMLYPGVSPVGVYNQQLSNGGERIALNDPLGHALPSLSYDDSSPWPAAADGGGWSLQWLPELGSNGDPASWVAAVPTPGAPLEPPGPDRDGDGLPDRWESQWKTDPDLPDAGADPDTDGSPNAAERAAGTDPHDPSDRL